jgi:outer membrane receptor protein involved in Fe transport
MLSGDPSARVYSLSAEDIARRGVSSLEELFRTLPWAFPSITTQTNMVFGAGASDTDQNLGALGLGTSTPMYQLPAGHSGVGATPDDFSSEIAKTDYVAPQNGEDSTNTSFNVRVEQYLTDNLRVYADVLVSNLDSWQQFQTTMTSYLVPASNAYNPFGRDMLVNYWPIHEVESGVIPPSYTESENKQRNYNAGLFWEFGGNHQFEFNITRSESEKFAWQIRTDWRRGEFDPSQAAFYAALESSDPNVALNLFGDGTAQGSAFTELFTAALGPSRGASELTAYEPLLRGQLFEIWGGPINYAVGAEFREEVIFSFSEGYREGGLTQTFGRIDVVGVDEPTEDLVAYFAEFAIPIVGRANARPGLRSLVLSLQARRDKYSFEGATGGVEGVRGFGTRRVYIPGTGWTSIPSSTFTDVGTPNIVETEKAATSPRVGLQYMPNDSLIVRAAWSKSFQPRVFSDQFSPNNARTFPGYYIDPYHPDGSLERIRPPAEFASFNPTTIRAFALRSSVAAPANTKTSRRSRLMR